MIANQQMIRQAVIDGHAAVDRAVRKLRAQSVDEELIQELLDTAGYDPPQKTVVYTDATDPN